MVYLGNLLAYICITKAILSIHCSAIDPLSTINAIFQSSNPVTQVDDDNSCHCRLFLWDIISYIKCSATNRLISQNTCEGLGGRKFVRVQPGSYFEKWLPHVRTGRLKKDGCCLCGYSFRQHLHYWSRCKRNKESSTFDEFLDSAFSNDLAGTLSNGHAFYRQYVDEVTSSAMRVKRKGKVMRESDYGGVAYLVPSFDPMADGKAKKPWTILMLFLARTASLERVEDLIMFSKLESSGKDRQVAS